MTLFPPNHARYRAADAYLARGWAPVPIPARKKAPALKGWQQLTPDKAQLAKHFAKAEGNVGVLLGEPSGWLVDVDLDCTEARRLAPAFLPTTATFGRASAPSSHFLYRVIGAVTTKFTAHREGRGGGGMLLELRSSGTQTVFPPSEHPSGEKITWENGKSRGAHGPRTTSALPAQDGPHCARTTSEGRTGGHSPAPSTAAVGCEGSTTQPAEVEEPGPDLAQCVGNAHALPAHYTAVPTHYAGFLPDAQNIRELDAGRLLRCCQHLAAASVCARNWPAAGSRQEAAGALAGVLARAGFSAERAAYFVGHVAGAAGDEEQGRRASFAKTTVERALTGGATTGLPKLGSLLGDGVAKQVAKWLGHPLRPGDDRPPAEGAGKEVSEDGERFSALLIDEAHRQGAVLFRTDDQRGFASLPGPEGRTAVPIRSPAMETWLQQIAYTRLGRPASSNAIHEANSVLNAQALLESKVAEVAVRVLQTSEATWLDLGRTQAVKMNASGWELVDDPGLVHFRRPGTFLRLPLPQSGFPLAKLRPLLNLADDASWQLVVVWLLACLVPSAPCPILILTGEQGAAKSTTARLLKCLLDPTKAPLRSLPQQEQDLLILARHCRILAFDNLSGLQHSFSDAFCRLVTGSGFGTRALYTNDEESVLEAKRALILNGIDDLVSRPDLGDRAIVLTLPAIPPDKRRGHELERAFEAQHPALLGAVLDAFVATMAALPDATRRLSQAPRMIEFARLGVAAEAALGWPQGSFLAALSACDQQLKDELLEADPVATAVLYYMQGRTDWQGTATELLEALNRPAPDSVRQSKGWPKNARALSMRLQRAAPVLRHAGVGCERRHRAKQRMIVLARTAVAPSPRVTTEGECQGPLREAGS